MRVVESESESEPQTIRGVTLAQRSTVDDYLKAEFFNCHLQRVKTRLDMIAFAYAFSMCFAPAPPAPSQMHQIFRTTIQLIAAVVLLVAFRWLICVAGLCYITAVLWSVWHPDPVQIQIA